jgi:hypothetical protein
MVAISFGCWWELVRQVSDSRDDGPIVTRKAGDTEVWIGGCMRSEGLEYGEYLYVQRETREEVGRGERTGAVSGTGREVHFTILFERRRSGMGEYGEQEAGSFMERLGAERVSTTSDPRFLRARP